jgi:TonB-linked SusC/RagA family outer membrane protein
MKIFSSNKGLRALFYSLILASLPVSALARANASPDGAAYFQQAISGVVSDASGPLPGTIVSVKGTTRSTISDADGKFSIVAAPEDVLVFSFTGYRPVEVTVGTQNTLKIELQEDSTQLEELEINAGYYSVKQKESTGSISRITSKDIETQPVTNVLATMQGRMAGVSVTQNTGVSGGGFDIQIRGQNSLRSDGNAPLYIIDGVPYASESIGSNVTGLVIPAGRSPLNSINPGDIASIEILKDADATAIYGSRGANGVVLITTKKGIVGKTQYQTKVSTGTGSVTRFMNLMNTQQYLFMRRQAFENDNKEYGPADYDVNGTWDQQRYTDWQEKLLGGTALFTDAQASITGGSPQTQFLLTGSLHKETTVFPGDFSYRRGNILTNISHTSVDGKFKLNLTAGYTLQDNRQPGADFTLLASQLAPNAPNLYDAQGNLNWENSTWTNPLSELESRYGAKTNDLLANGVLAYEVIPGLTAKSSMGFTDTRYEDSTTNPSSMFDPAFLLGSEYSSIYVSNNKRQTWIVEPQLDWKHDFGNFRTNILIGSTFQQRTGQQLVQQAMGFTSNSLIHNLSASTTTDVLSDIETVYKYNAAYARLNGSWNGRYFLNLTARRDGSSRFGPRRQFANFGAVGAAWIFSETAFMKKTMPVLNFGKLRGSYGTSGNDQIGDYQFLDTYSTSGNNYGNTNGLIPSRLFNAKFGWETNRKLELALETGWLNDRIFFTGAYYTNRSSNQLVGIPLPATTGFSSLQANLDAVVENSGIELSLRTVNCQTNDFNWATNINFSIGRNKLLSFPGLDGSTYQNQYVIGQPLNIRKVYHYTGMDPVTGVYQFEDVNGDGAITASDDQQTVVDLNPEFFGGLQNTISYKQWRLDFLFQFVKQRNFNQAYGLGLPGSMNNQSVDMLGGWTGPGDTTPIQPYSTGSGSASQAAFFRYTASDAAFTDASFIRLKNVSLTYVIPKNVIKGIDCSITAEAQNLITITPYKGPDPESRFTNRLPPLRVITAGIQLNF